MIDFLALQVRMGNLPIERVPDRYRDAVVVWLSEH